MPNFPAEFWYGVSTSGKIIIALILMFGILGSIAIRGVFKLLAKTKSVAEHAVELSKPTGNGFASRTSNSLGYIAGKIDEIQEDLRDISKRVESLEHTRTTWLERKFHVGNDTNTRSGSPTNRRTQPALDKSEDARKRSRRLSRDSESLPRD